MDDMTDSVTFLHSSDLQIGMTRWFLSAEAQARFDDDRIRSIERMGEVAVAYLTRYSGLRVSFSDHVK